MSTGDLTRREAFLVLAGLSGLGPVLQQRLLEHFDGDPRAVLAASPKALAGIERVGKNLARQIAQWSEHFDLAAEEDRLQRSGVAFVSLDEEGYPSLLREIDDPPVGLYCAGPLRLTEKCVAIVGSRRTTLYGREMARRLAGDLAARGLCVVSGMARGIDAAAHEGALDSGGPSVAVLGCGVDIIYPPEHYELYQRLRAKGAVVSELRFGTRASKMTFPMRNRVIAGMCSAVVVVESDDRGGSMITAKFAADYNRILCAVPGRVDSEAARGCHQLIRDGAVLCRGVEDILEELNYANQLEIPLDAEGERNLPGFLEESSDLTGDEKEIVKFLFDAGAAPIDSVAEGLSMAASSVSALLLMLELKGKVKKRADGRFELTPFQN